MKKFLRENLMIVLSIALPLLVAVFFALASFLPALFSSPPQHDFFLSLHGGRLSTHSQLRVNIVSEDERIKVLAIKSDGTNFDKTPRLFRFNHETGDVSEVSIPIPGDVSAFEQQSEIHVEELSGLKISNRLRAPDGYEFRGRRRGGGLVTELFGGSRNRADVSIAKSGAIIRVPLPSSDYWYNDIRFVGWVIE